jgi:aryl-alcohol dehydrogenase-like predicted oxidoreductase
VRSIADRKQVIPGQLALAWLLAKGEDMVPIPGTKRRTYLEQNVAAVGIMLTRDEIAAIESAVPLDAIAGDRYADVIMKDTREM